MPFSAPSPPLSTADTPLLVTRTGVSSMVHCPQAWRGPAHEQRQMRGWKSGRTPYNTPTKCNSLWISNLRVPRRFKAAHHQLSSSSGTVQAMKEKKKDGEGGGRPRGSRKNIIGRYVILHYIYLLKCPSVARVLLWCDSHLLIRAAAMALCALATKPFVPSDSRWLHEGHHHHHHTIGELAKGRRWVYSRFWVAWFCMSYLLLSIAPLLLSLPLYSSTATSDVWVRCEIHYCCHPSQYTTHKRAKGWSKGRSLLKHSHVPLRL